MRQSLLTAPMISGQRLFVTHSWCQPGENSRKARRVARHRNKVNRQPSSQRLTSVVPFLPRAPTPPAGAYFCTILSTFIYTAVPMVSLVWGVHPVTLNRQFALAATLYFLAGGTGMEWRLVSLQERNRTSFA
jgi:hypothetical protein